MHLSAFLHFCIPAILALHRQSSTVPSRRPPAPSCAACGRASRTSDAGAGLRACWRSILPLTPPLCDRCGDPLPTWRAISIPLATCPRCRRGAQHVDRARAIGAYDGALRAIVHALKYEGRRSLARPLAELMRSRGADMLTAPTGSCRCRCTASRRRERGFNQAADLARHLGLPVVPIAASHAGDRDADRPAGGAAPRQRARRVRARTRAGRPARAGTAGRAGRVDRGSGRRRQHDRRDARCVRAGAQGGRRA